MMLVDAGPLIALINANDPNHLRCAQCLNRLGDQSLVTTWPCFTETMYFLHKAGGQPAQEELWNFLDDGLVSLHLLSGGEVRRMRQLMKKYSDTPMDLADASLVAAAEALGIRLIFTLDSHFHAYRITGSEAFELVPAQFG